MLMKAIRVYRDTHLFSAEHAMKITIINSVEMKHRGGEKIEEKSMSRELELVFWQNKKYITFEHFLKLKKQVHKGVDIHKSGMFINFLITDSISDF